MSVHACDGEPVEGGDGFLVARCVCGWRQGGLPDMEVAIDELMEHARIEGDAAVDLREIDAP